MQQDTIHADVARHGSGDIGAVAAYHALSTAAGDSASVGDSTMRISRPMTPYQVLRMLPKDATPAQQDSAIQAWFQPGEIHYSECPDTLHLPGHGKGRSPKDADLPQYYRENFFSNASMLHPELRGEGHYGVAGSPVPYTISGDNLITSLLLGCFIIMTLAYVGSRTFVARQLKSFFYVPHADSETINETSIELQLQTVVGLLGCMLMAIIYYFYVRTYVADTFILTDDYMLIAVYSCVAVAYYLVIGLAYTMVNSVFFGTRKNVQWLKSLLFIQSLFSVMLFPLVMLLGRLFFGEKLSRNKLIGMALIMLGVSLVSLAAVAGGYWVVFHVISGYTWSLRSALFRKVHTMTLAEVGRIGTSNLVTRSTHDVGTLNWVVSMLCGNIIIIFFCMSHKKTFIITKIYY